MSPGSPKSELQAHIAEIDCNAQRDTGMEMSMYVRRPMRIQRNYAMLSLLISTAPLTAERDRRTRCRS